jgi:hypothetical protein
MENDDKNVFSVAVALMVEVMGLEIGTLHGGC